MLKKEKFDKAKAVFIKLEDYKDSEEMVTECDYQHAVFMLNNGQLKEAKMCFFDLKDYKDSEKYYGSIIGKATVSSYTDEDGTYEYKEVFNSDGQREHLTTKNPKGEIYEYSYKYETDSDKNITKEECYLKGNLNYVKEFQYNSKNECIKETETRDGKTEETIYTYDENGNCIFQQITYDDGDCLKKRFTYNGQGDYIKEEWEWTLASYRLLSTYELSYDYDDNGNIKTKNREETYLGTVIYGKTIEHNPDSTDITHYEYDEYNNQTLRETQYSDGSIYKEVCSAFEYFYLPQ